MSIEVLSAGMYSSIQDKGRENYRQYGVPLSGVIDNYSAKLANLLLENEEDAALMEITMVGPKLKINKNTQAVLCGLGAEITLNDKTIKINEVFSIQKGAILHIKKITKGCRVYLGVKYGFQTEKILGSRSMYDGITKNDMIKKGAIILIQEHKEQLSPTNSTVRFEEERFTTNKIEVLPGPEFHLLSEKTKKELLKTSFSISADSNRMAIAMNELQKNDLKNILTSAVLPGTVQLTSGGKIIVLMKDCQVTGGYPRILQMSENGMNCLAQKRAGERIYFKLL